MIEFAPPTDLFGVLWLGVGFQLGIAFGTKLDQDIQGSEWFKALKPDWLKGSIERALKFLHHWIFGLILIVYSPGSGLAFGGELYWIGWGLFIGDALDYPLRQYLKMPVI